MTYAVLLPLALMSEENVHDVHAKMRNKSCRW